MAATQGHFLRSLEALAAGPKSLTCLVHPVVPVIDETRPLVKQYNAILRAAVRELGHSRIRWLDGVFEGLLDAQGGGGLRAQFRLDGTHLHPSYVTELLAPALGRALP